MKTEAGKPVVARMDANLLDKIQSISDSLNLSRSAAVRLLIHVGLKHFDTL
ncbi:hypothetical protein [Desulfovibrio sp. TomC]|uniref:hypothetical protein n=1 Tax=Desulfovibrio sp. TomC TaxID=1562888 RepID=UPI0012E13A37|nr:hypothetical protein [Desulfovibrio sp. TomC]